VNFTFAGTSSIQTPVKVNASVSTSSVSGGLLKRKRASSSQEDSGKVFSFGEARVREYLSSLSSDDSSSCSRSPSDRSKHLTAEPADTAQPVFVFSPKQKKTARFEEVVPLFEDISSQGDMEVLDHITQRIPSDVCVKVGDRLSSNDEAESACTASEGQQNEQGVSPLREDAERLLCDSDCVSESGVNYATGSHSNERLEGPLTRSRKRQLDDSSSSSSLGNGSCNGGNGEDGKVVKRTKYHLKRQHRHRHHRGGKRVKRIPTITVE
jgi:hypothetical protein